MAQVVFQSIYLGFDLSSDDGMVLSINVDGDFTHAQVQFDQKHCSAINI